jgi:hypothetical protein
MDAHKYITFSKFEYLMYLLVHWFFGPVFVQFRFLGSTGSITSMVLITLIPSSLLPNVHSYHHPFAQRNEI